MVAMRSDSVLDVLLSNASVEFDTAQPTEEESLPLGSGPLMPEELDGERDLGSLELPEEYEEMYERSFYNPYG